MVPSIVLFELWYGAAKSQQKEKNISRLDVLMHPPFRIAALDEEDARVAGEIRAELEARGTPIGPYDYLMAAQALRRGATLVTANLREFGRVDALRLENWT
jgi:tRNA(fMet)-specific endonuclease VapC